MMGDEICIMVQNGRMHADPINNDSLRRSVGAHIADPFFAEGLFDALPDVVFFVKDARGAMWWSTRPWSSVAASGTSRR
jgi:hypothetical protein